MKPPQSAPWRVYLWPPGFSRYSSTTCATCSTHTDTYTHLWGALLHQSPDRNGSGKPNGFWRWLGKRFVKKTEKRSNSQFMLGTYFYITKSWFTIPKADLDIEQAWGHKFVYRWRFQVYYIRMWSNVYVTLCMCMYMYVHIYIYIYIHTYIYIYIYIHIYIYIQYYTYTLTIPTLQTQTLTVTNSLIHWGGSAPLVTIWSLIGTA